jgi:peptidyl-prolyl cis-trans isomerase C
VSLASRHDLRHFSAYEPGQIQRLFGRTEFAAAAFSAPLLRWAGPFRSGYGWHLIRVEARQQAQQPELSAVRDQVRTDFLLEAQARVNRTAFDDLASQFKVVRTKS